MYKIFVFVCVTAAYTFIFRSIHFMYFLQHKNLLKTKFNIEIFFFVCIWFVAVSGGLYTIYSLLFRGDHVKCLKNDFFFQQIAMSKVKVIACEKIFAKVKLELSFFVFFKWNNWAGKLVEEIVTKSGSEGQYKIEDYVIDSYRKPTTKAR